eukprot:6551633-Pyramimonas_sp.AAC.1
MDNTSCAPSVSRNSHPCHARASRYTGGHANVYGFFACVRACVCTIAGSVTLCPAADAKNA